MATAWYLIAVGSGRPSSALSKRLPASLAPNGRSLPADRQSRAVDFA
jgi:hypothetical protein